jgi:hypothetical protein
MSGERSSADSTPRKFPISSIAVICLAFVVVGAVWRHSMTQSSASLPLRSKAVPTDVVRLDAPRADAAPAKKPVRKAEFRSTHAQLQKLYSLIDIRFRSKDERFWRNVQSGPPMTKRLKAMLADLRVEFGEDLLDLLSDGLGAATSDDYKSILAGLLAVSDNPDALPSLRATVLDQELDETVRRWAYYGIARMDPGSWKLLEGTFAQALKDDDQPTLNSLLPGLAQFGTQAIPLLLSYKDGLKRFGSLRYLEGKEGVREALQKLALETKDPHVLGPAMIALSRPWNKDGLLWILERAQDPANAALQRECQNALSGFVRYGVEADSEEGAVEAGSDPELLARLKEQYLKKPDPVAFAALAALPMFRKEFPDYLERLVPGGIEKQQKLPALVVSTLARIPEAQPALSAYLARLSPEALSEAITIAGQAVTSARTPVTKELSAIADRFAVDPKGDANVRTHACVLLAQADDLAVQQAIQKMGSVYLSMESMEARQNYLIPSMYIGSRATEFYANILNQEKNEILRWDLMYYVFVIPGNVTDQKVVNLFRPQAEQMLSAYLGKGTIIASSPGGIDMTPMYVQAERYPNQTVELHSRALCKMLTAYGTEANLPQIESISERLYFPAYLTDDKDQAIWMQTIMKTNIQPAVDSIRMRLAK